MTKQIHVCLDPQSQMENCLNSAEVEVKGTGNNDFTMFTSTSVTYIRYLQNAIKNKSL